MGAIVCPSGLAGQVRRLQVRELDHIAKRSKGGRDGGLTDNYILESCWLETTHEGPYDFLSGKAVDWKRILTGDRFYALLQINRETFGDEFSFTPRCENDECGEPIPWTVKVSELPVRTLSEASAETFKTSNRFETRLPEAGNKVSFKLSVGSDNAKAAALVRQGVGNVTASLLSRIVEIEGVDISRRREFLESLSWAELFGLLDSMDEVDCGVATTIEVECQQCFEVQEVNLPFQGKKFWSARRLRTRRPSSPSRIATSSGEASPS